MDIIVTHINADFDALASMVAAKKLYPQAHLVFAGSQERSVREFLTLTKDIVRIESERECNLEGVKRVIIVDTCVISRIGKIGEYIKNHNDVPVHIYDHHPKSEFDFKPKHMTWREIGATTTILAAIIKKKKISITPLEATIMALGIYEDTGSLTYPTTTKEDMDMVGFLLNQGANLSVVSTYLTRELNEDEMLLLTALLHSTESYQINGVKVAIAQAIGTEFSGDLAVLTHKLLEIENFNVLFTLIKLNNKIQLVGRSRLPSVSVGDIGKELGGGGHHSACAACLQNVSLEEIKQKLIALLNKYIQPIAYAKDLMTYPVKTVTPEQKVAEVKDMMVHLNLNGMPVVDKGKIVGIITRHDLDKAIHHGFSHARVKGYMYSDVITITENTPIHEIQNIMYEHNIGRLPVLKNKKLIGIVSRTDLLQVIHGGLVSSVNKEDRPQAPSIEDISKKMKAKLPGHVFSILTKCGEIAEDMSYCAYAVGGFVRDLLLGIDNFDIDIVVEGDGIIFAKRLACELKADIKKHPRFGTAGITLDNGLHIDIATSRREYYEYPAALPIVEMSSIKHDLYRRDFTINTIAIKLNKSGFGQLVDFFNGIRDIKAKKIRVLHNLSFVEDPTRIFRAVRFEQRFEFEIDKHTQHLIKTAIDLDMFEKVNFHRLREEIILLLSEPYPAKVLRRMAQLHELKFIHKDLVLNKHIIKLCEDCQETVNWFKLSFMGKSIDTWLVFFMALVDNLSAGKIDKICKILVLTRKDRERLLQIAKYQKQILKLISAKLMPNSQIFRALHGICPEGVLFLMAKSGDVQTKKRISLYLTKLNTIKLTISGEDLKKIGYLPGPKFKKVLESALYAKLDLKLKTRLDEIKFVKNAMMTRTYKIKGK